MKLLVLSGLGCLALIAPAAAGALAAPSAVSSAWLGALESLSGPRLLLVDDDDDDGYRPRSRYRERYRDRGRYDRDRSRYRSQRRSRDDDDDDD